MPEGPNDVLLKKAAGPGEDPRDHVQPSLENVSNWETNLGDRKAFRVRGLSWFRKTVQRDIDRLKPHITKMEEEREKWPRWCTQELDWNDKFSIQQVYQAAKDQSGLKFVKAAKVLLLCELVGLKAGIPSAVTYEKMRIEPALFGIADFTEEALAKAVEKYPTLLGTLRDKTGQETIKVFEAMARGNAVSYRLAWKTRQELAALTDASFQWGPVIIRNATKKPPEVSGHEVIDGPSVPEGAPNPFQPPGFAPPTTPPPV